MKIVIWLFFWMILFSGLSFFAMHKSKECEQSEFATVCLFCRLYGVFSSSSDLIDSEKMLNDLHEWQKRTGISDLISSYRHMLQPLELDRDLKQRLSFSISFFKNFLSQECAFKPEMEHYKALAKALLQESVKVAE